MFIWCYHHGVAIARGHLAHLMEYQSTGRHVTDRGTIKLIGIRHRQIYSRPIYIHQRYSILLIS